MNEISTEDKVLNAAVKVFAEKGFKAGSTKEIAETANVAEGTIFRYYKTKNDIMEGALKRVIKLFSDEKKLRRVETIIAETGDDSPKTILTELISDRMVIFRENSDLIKIILIEAQYNEGISKKFYYTVMTKLMPALMDFFIKGAEAGTLRALDNDERMAAIRSFISIAAGSVMQQAYAPNLLMIEPDKDIDFTVELFLSGIQNKQINNA